MYFYYAERELEYLKAKDERLREVIEKIGHVDREVDTDLFSSVVHHIIGQQISTKAQATIWARMKAQFGEVNAESISAADIDTLQSFGMTFRKAEYIKDFAEKVKTGEFALQEISQLPDNEAIQALASLKGRGICFTGNFPVAGQRSNQGAGFFERNRRMDSGNDFAVLLAAA